VINLEKHLNTREQRRFGVSDASRASSRVDLNSFDYYKEFYVKNYGSRGDSQNTFAESWNNLLEIFWIKRHLLWDSKRYDEFNFNCLNFIVSFLLEFGFFDLNEDDATDFLYQTSLIELLKSEWIEPNHNPLLIGLLKQRFSNEFIEPEFLKCLRFLNLLVKLKEKKCFKENV
jgi:hypothetical protein